jgi:hypothetical protein
VKISLGKFTPLQEPPLPHKMIPVESPSAENSPSTTRISLYFPISNYIHKQGASFLTYKPFPRVCGRSSYPQRYSCWVFQLCWANGYFKTLIRWLLGRTDHGRGPLALQSFWSLKTGTITFNFCSNRHFLYILELLVRCDQPWEKQPNKHASVIFLLGKNTKFHIFADGSLKLRH